MSDKKQVMSEIERCICRVPGACRDCSHYTGTVSLGCMESLMSDALTLMKEQEPIMIKTRMPDDRKRCWLMEGCPSRTAVCYSCVPDGDDCPIWRWFKKQIVVRCKDCQYYNENTGVCCRGIVHGFAETWFCADGKRKEDG